MTDLARNSIRVLPKLLVDQIAAGEVIERPAAVVRELVDNAIDAGAGSIEVEIEAGGRTLIRVSDDGSGIGLDELSLAFASHATSKLSDLDDLTSIVTLGFRGEALASMAAVSRAKIRSRTEGAQHGGELDCEGGRLAPSRPAARARGTDVEVRDLFFNTPARRRFLKRDSTEAGHALDTVVRQAISHPEIAFRAFVDGKLALDFPPGGALDSQEKIVAVRRERIRKTLGERSEQDLTFFSLTEHGLSLEGFVGSPETAVRGSSGLHLFVNSRWIQDRGAARVVRDATKDFFGFRQPLVFLFVSMDPALLDVNVHPAKLEVRFREQGAVYGAIHRGLRGIYERTRPAGSPEALLSRAPAIAFPNVKSQSYGAPPRPAGALEVREPVLSMGAAPTRGGLFGEAEGETLVPRGCKYLRAFETFLVIESEDGLDLVDQHALHERVNFEELRARVLQGDAPRQGLLIPESVELTRAEMALVEEFADLWASIGLDVASVGPSTVAIRAIPAGFNRLPVPSLLADLLELARQEKTPTSARIREEMLHRCACHASVKAGDPLTDEEIESLLARASRLPADQTCPHGRPTRIRLTLRDLERAFERS